MSLSVTYSNPAFPEGTEFSVEGLGLLVNGTPVDVPDESVALFESIHDEPAQQVLQDDESFNLGGASPGPQQQQQPPEGGEE